MTSRLLIVLAVLSPTVAAAQSATLDARSARAIVDGCIAHATAKGQAQAIVVSDIGGTPIALMRMDRSGAGATLFAIEKAKAAAMWGFATSGMAEGAKGTPGFAFAPYVVTVAGGVPILSGDGRTQLGAIGVSGEAPEDDESCAKAGVAVAGFKTER